MKERPIIYSTPMVQALLDDKKTMTRRIFKDDPKLQFDANIDLSTWFKEHYEYIMSFCTYGKPGDVLYVRESFSYYDGVGFNYKADFKAPECFKWKPSIHMPKAAARIWLQITDVRVERLQEISEPDAKAEGVERKAMSEVFKCRTLYKYKDYIFTKSELIPDAFNYLSPVNSFKSLWTLINGANSWADNPWVWVISFKVLSKTGYNDIPEEIRKSNSVSILNKHTAIEITNEERKNLYI